MTPTLFLLAYALGLLTAGLWACAWWCCKRARIALLLHAEAVAHDSTLKARTFEEAAQRGSRWVAAVWAVEREIQA